MKYPIKYPITVDGNAGERWSELADYEPDGRVIGGDEGDVYFQGYDVDVNDETTTLFRPVLVTTRGPRLTKDEAYEIASEIVSVYVNSVGVTGLRH